MTIIGQMQVVGLFESGLIQSVGDLSHAFGLFESGLIQSVGDLSSGLGNPDFCVSTLACHQQFLLGSFVNYSSAFTRFFGDNANQDFNNIYINKADLIGVKPQSNNTAESLLVALLLRIKDFESDDFTSRIIVELFKQEIIYSKNIPIIQTVVLIKLRTTANYSYLALTNYAQPITPSNILN